MYKKTRTQRVLHFMGDSLVYLVLFLLGLLVSLTIGKIFYLILFKL